MTIIQNLEGNVAVCNVVGPLRTGKSYILNLLLNEKNAFELGGSVDSCTRGIWMWDTPIKHKNKHGEFNLILMDTEGLGSNDRGTELDNKIFVLSLLLSSYFVLNTKNVIDRDAIKKLAIMADLSSFINSSINNKDDQNKNFALNSPDFVWCLRDFFLDLNGRTPKQYLQESLQIEAIGKRNAKEIEEANFIREAVKKSFKSIDICCLPMPINNGLNGMSIEKTLQNLGKVDFNNLREDFRTGIIKLCDTMKINICPKSVLTVPLSSSAFSKFIQVVVDQLNNNDRVSLTESLALSIKYASEKALVGALRNYEAKTEEYLSKNPMPLRWDILDAKHKEIMDRCYKILEMHLNGSNDFTRPILENFQREICQYEGKGKNLKLIDGLFFEIRNQNLLKIKEFNKSLLNNLWKTDIVNKFFNGAQDQNMGQNFILAYEKLKNTYNQKSFHKIEPEMSESFSEWYKEKDIENVIKNMKFLSDQVKAKLEKEQQLVKERANRERVEKNLQDAIYMQRENERITNEKIIEIQTAHANQVKDLGDQLNDAQAAAYAAQKAADAALAQIADMIAKQKKKKWWKFW